jgi:hypothetical protein
MYVQTRWGTGPLVTTASLLNSVEQRVGVLDLDWKCPLDSIILLPVRVVAEKQVDREIPTAQVCSIATTSARRLEQIVTGPCGGRGASRYR